MNKVIRYVQVYLVLGFPLVIACMIWSTFDPQMTDSVGFSLKHLVWEILAYNLMLWYITLILFLFSLILFSNIREKTLCFLANIKERDEREQYITGKAARFAYISNLGLLIFFLFFSTFSLKISVLPERPEGKRSNVHVGVGLHTDLVENKAPAAKIAENKTQEKTILNYNSYSLSNTTILLILLSWQLIAFNLAARKERNK